MDYTNVCCLNQIDQAFLKPKVAKFFWWVVTCGCDFGYFNRIYEIFDFILVGGRVPNKD